MIIKLLFLTLLCIAVTRRNSYIRSAGCMFTFMICTQSILGFTGSMYYVADALALYIVIEALRRLPALSSIIHLQSICWAGILINLYGLVIYHLYLEPITYNLLFVGLYIYTGAVLLLYDGFFKRCFRRYNYNRDVDQGRVNNHKQMAVI